MPEEQKPVTSGRVTTDRTDSESETESDTETTEESGTESDTAAAEENTKRGFASPLEAVAFYMGVPVIISVFAVIASVCRRIIYSDKKR